MPANCFLLMSSPATIRDLITRADVVVGAVLIPGAKAPRLITRDMLKTMKKGAVLVDVAIDQGGCFETSRPTTIREPAFKAHGVVHYCVPNLTADLGRSTSISLAWAVLPYLLRLAGDGVEGALAASPELAGGVYTHNGVCVHRQLAAAFAKSYRPLADVLSGTRVKHALDGPVSF
jgi:alanine dehydrogenase